MSATGSIISMKRFAAGLNAAAEQDREDLFVVPPRAFGFWLSPTNRSRRIP
jgi:hypothetical protein